MDIVADPHSGWRPIAARTGAGPERDARFNAQGAGVSAVGGGTRAREGVALNVIQRQLGHANLGTTSI